MPEVADNQTPAFATGNGQNDTHAVEIDDRQNGGTRLNPHSRAGQPYGQITGPGIASLAQNPAAQPKSDAPWFIPSTYCEHDARSHSAQKENGKFRVLPGDIDKGNKSLDEVGAALDAVIGPDVSRIIYSTSSATSDNQKWRYLLFLSDALDGVDYKDTQDALFALLRYQGIQCDQALNRPGQLIYLPNVPPEKRNENGTPAFYKHELHRGVLLNLDAASPIIQRREAIRADVVKAAEEAAEKREKTLAIATDSDGLQPISEFNKNHSIEEMLERYGYDRDGRSSHWRSPNQTSGSYATKVFEGKIWVSLSESDMAAGLGMQREISCCGDAFDLFKHYEHDGDERAAVRAYGKVINPTQNVVPFSGTLNLPTAAPEAPNEQPPSLPAIKDEALTDWTFLSGDNEFYNPTTGEILGVSAFNLAKLPITPEVQVGNNKDGDPVYKKFQPSKTLIEYESGEVVYGTMYRPDQEPGSFFVDGIKYINSYMPASVPKPEQEWRENPSWQVCKAHIENILGNDANIICQWMAHNVQKPGKKILWAPVIVGVQGDGKTTIAKMLTAAMGVRNVSPVSPEAMFSDFTSWAEGACVKVLEEIRVLGNNRHDAMNKLKPLITNDTVEVVRKGKDGKQVINVTNYLALTNHMDALALDEGDRRWGVFKTRFEHRQHMLSELDDAYWQALHDAIDHNPGVIRSWLLDYDISSFNRVAGPQTNSHKKVMIDLTKPADVQDVEQAIELGWMGVHPDVLATDCLNAAMIDACGVKMNTRRLATALDLAGWVKIPGVLYWRSKNRKLWRRKGAGIASKSNAEIRDILDQTATELSIET
ncbi:primase-helicase family protein [uncultured Ruegeria sp.]|uniref:primase-helicase family protein n=1 Tax=uncultured Ruegeria sp. TaxID=259304 RepID=UPI00262FAE32|nr:primase-helicase family protein [uncultured Ruegeria sp.]